MFAKLSLIAEGWVMVTAIILIQPALSVTETV